MFWTCVGLLLLGVLCRGQDDGFQRCGDMPDGTGILPDDALDCQHYLECDNMVLRQRPCAGGTAFNSTERRCSNRLEEVNCFTQRSTGPQLCANRGNPENCNQFFQCDHGEDILMSCGIGAIFSDQFKICVHDDPDVLLSLDCQYLLQ